MVVVFCPTFPPSFFLFVWAMEFLGKFGGSLVLILFVVSSSGLFVLGTSRATNISVDDINLHAIYLFDGCSFLLVYRHRGRRLLLDFLPPPPPHLSRIPHHRSTLATTVAMTSQALHIRPLSAALDTLTHITGRRILTSTLFRVSVWHKNAVISIPAAKSLPQARSTTAYC